MLPNAKYYVLVGHYGSGKTELALAIARHLNKSRPSGVALVDLDIVNPYFRSSQQRELLAREGINVISPSMAHSTVDVPALTANVHTVFDSDRYDHVVIDVGGDAAGATALGRYHPLIQPIRDQMKVLYVVNPLRPLSAVSADIAALLSQIEARSRLKPDMLVNNANLQRQTTAQQLIDGQALLASVAQQLHIPIGLVAGYARLQMDLPPEMQAIYFPIEPVMLPEWLEDDSV